MNSETTLDCSFTYHHFRDTLRAALDRGYAFQSFSDAHTPGAGPRMLLRHDVDHSPSAALRLAEIESDLGVSATYFILLSGEYNALGSSLGTLRKIVQLGHWVGVHYDPLFYLEQRLPYPQTVHRDAELIRDRLGADVVAAARHNPVVGAVAEESLSPLIDTYDPAIRRQYRYLSDSCQHWREGCFCAAVRQPEAQRLQILIHAEWWSADGARADTLLDRIREERIAAAHLADDETRRLFAGLEHLPTRGLFERRGGRSPASDR